MKINFFIIITALLGFSVFSPVLVFADNGESLIITTPQPNTRTLSSSGLIVVGRIGAIDEECYSDSHYSKGFFGIRLFNANKDSQIIDFVEKANEGVLSSQPKYLQEDWCGKINFRASFPYEFQKVDIKTTRYRSYKAISYLAPGMYILEVKRYSKNFQEMEKTDIPIELIDYSSFSVEDCANYWDDEYRKVLYADSVDDISRIDSCYSFLAAEKKDINICARISDAPGMVKEQCYEGLVEDFRQSCEDLSIAEKKRECQNALRTFRGIEIVGNFQDRWQSFFNGNEVGIWMKNFFPWLLGVALIVWIFFLHFKKRDISAKIGYYTASLAILLSSSGIVIGIFSFNALLLNTVGLPWLLSQHCDYGKAAIIKALAFIVFDFIAFSLLFEKLSAVSIFTITRKRRIIMAIILHVLVACIAWALISALLFAGLLSSPEWCGT